jgi:NADPH2:quinone reductase
MKSIVAQGGSAAANVAAFTIEDQPIPKPEPRDLLVRIVAIGLNPVDTKVRKRMEGTKTLGWDAYGVVEEIGEQVKGFAVDDRVFYAGDITRPGCNSEYHLVDERIAAIAPEEMSPEDAVAMPLTSITAWEALFDRLGFVPEQNANPGKSILIIGGAGGVGSIATQLARWAGLKVYATASRPETNEWCQKLGADVILNHQNNLFEELQAADAEFVDAIFCTTQMERHWKVMSECIRPQGRVALIDDPVNPVDITLFKQKSVSIAWEFMYTRSMFQTEDIASQGKLLTTVASLLNDGTLVTTRQETLKGLTVENIRAMHVRQESGKMIGKQVLVI